ncbi:unnamed protein product [Victoria cruziana]
MRRKGDPLVIFLIILFVGTASTVSAAPPGFVASFLSNAFAALLKYSKSLSVTTKTAVTGRPMMQFESGYTVETVFDGSKLGIEPYSVQVSQNGELLVLDSLNSNLYKISMPLSRYSRARLVAGSTEGYSGHVDGKAREARMNHPKSFTVDDKGNIYVADSMNMAIRKISDAGVTTIAGGKWSRGDHVDGPSEDAKFSNDFEVIYIASSCSLLVIDRGKQAIREIQLHVDDCAYQYENQFSSGIAVLLGAGFFGYMLALLQRRVGTIVSPQKDSDNMGKVTFPSTSPLKSSMRPPLIPVDGETEKQDAGWGSFFKFFVEVLSSILEIIGGLFSTSRKKPQDEPNSYVYQQQQHRRAGAWPAQESFVIPESDEPPSLETRAPTPKKSYPFMFKEIEKTHHIRNGRERPYYNNWEPEQQQQHYHQERIHQLRHHSSVAQTFYEPSCESNKEIVFGAVQEEGGKQQTMEIKPVDYGDPMYDYHNLRSRSHFMAYNHGF